MMIKNRLDIICIEEQNKMLYESNFHKAFY